MAEVPLRALNDTPEHKPNSLFHFILHSLSLAIKHTVQGRFQSMWLVISANSVHKSGILSLYALMPLRKNTQQESSKHPSLHVTSETGN